MKEMKIIEYLKVLASDCGFLQLRDTVATLPGTSYFSIFYNPSQMDKLELRLIPTFNGLSRGPSIVERFEKAEQVCKLRKIKEPSMVIPEAHERS